MNKKISILSLLVSLTLFSCYKSNERNLSVDDLDTVLTYHAPGFDFGAQKTFILPDSIVRISNAGQPVTRQAGPYDKAILSRIRNNMELRGYVELVNPTVSDDPDLALVVTVVVIDNYVVSNPYYYWDYWGYYGPGYGMYYPGAIIVDSYSTGSLLINMVDPDLKDPDRKLIPVQWFGAIDGILENNRASTQTRVIDGIDQAFEQSTYLYSR